MSRFALPPLPSIVPLTLALCLSGAMACSTSSRQPDVMVPEDGRLVVDVALSDVPDSVSGELTSQDITDQRIEPDLDHFAPDLSPDAELLVDVAEVETQAPLDPDGDADFDGYTNGEEAALGTDPLDPASARMWHPEWSEYPRLVFGPGAVEQLRSDVAMATGHRKTMLSRVKAVADQLPADARPDSYDPYHEVGRARIAAAAAFWSLITEDEVYAQKAASIAATLNPNLDEVGFSSPFYTKTSIHAGEALTYYAKAYDWLRGGELMSQAQLADARDAILEFTRRFETEAISGPMAALLVLAQNNHNVKAYGAIGLAGMVFYEEPEAARWVHRGVTEVRYYFLDFQTSVDGGYAEGPNYLTYCLGEGLSLLYAYHRFTEGDASYVRHFYDTREEGPALFEWIDDPMSEPLLKDLFLWPVKIMLPGGKSPNIDDASLSAVPGGYLAPLFGEPVFLWHWQLPQVGLPSSAGVDLSADIFALLDEEMTGSAPEFGPSLMLEAAGNCVLRDGYGDTDFMLLLLGEHGKVRQHGQGHEHPDASQLIIHAHGEYLLMDSGYISWEEKEPVAHAVNHNLILVNGEGPPDSEYTGVGSDTYLSHFHGSEPHFRRCRSATNYQETDFVRDLVVVDSDLVVVLDRFQAPQPGELQLLWHGNGGATSNGLFELDGYRARWSRPGATLHAAVSGWPNGASCANLTQTHSFHHGVALEHEMLACQMTAQNGHFLTVFGIEGEPKTGWEINELATLSADDASGLVATSHSQTRVVVFAPSGATLPHPSGGDCGSIAVPPGLSVSILSDGCEIAETLTTTIP